MSKEREDLIKKMGQKEFDKRKGRFNDPAGIIGKKLDDATREALLGALGDKKSSFQRSTLPSRKRK